MGAKERPIVGFNPPVYQCKRARMPLELNGDLDKEFWQDADFTDDFIDIEGVTKKEPRFKTRVKMLWDDENFYFGAELLGDEIWATIKERDEVIFYDNDFEIFIDPDSDTHQYFEFEMNALNTVWDLFLTKPYRDHGIPINGWDIKGLKTAVKIYGELNNPQANNRKWTAEIVMPFKSLIEANKPVNIPMEGAYWRVNFSRVQWEIEVQNNKYIKKINTKTNKILPEDNWVWSPTGVVNIHYPELWGFVFFTKENQEYEIPKDEKIKWVLRQLYYEQHNYYELNGTFTSDLNALLKNSDASINLSLCEDLLMEATTHCFEINCKSFNGQERVFIFEDGKVTKK